MNSEVFRRRRGLLLDQRLAGQIDQAAYERLTADIQHLEAQIASATPRPHLVEGDSVGNRPTRTDESPPLVPEKVRADALPFDSVGDRPTVSRPTEPPQANDSVGDRPTVPSPLPAPRDSVGDRVTAVGDRVRDIPLTGNLQGRIFLGRYEVVRLLAQGGMGMVYLARQNDLNRQVVIKVMRDHVVADPIFRERFQREMLLMARFQHPFAVTLYDASLDDPHGPCIVMEYIKGVSLDVLVRRDGRLAPARVARLLRPLAEALWSAHQSGMIHRDLKPSNLMVVDPGTPWEKLKVLDFGLAKLIGPDARSRVTSAEFAVGTPSYMCPEQARGEEMDLRGDLYSVGVILFELLTGRLPFAGSSAMDVLLAHAVDAPPSFREIGVVEIPPPIERVVQTCLAKNPEQRPPDARALVARFEEALAQPATGLAPLNPPEIQPPSNTSLLSAAPIVVPESKVVVPETEPRRPNRTPPSDPKAVVHHLEAWMPEKIATFKLRGFIQDVNGEMVESVPGRILTRLGGRGCVYQIPPRKFSWLRLWRSAATLEMELLLVRPPERDNQLHITVTFRSKNTDLSIDKDWRSLCTQIFCDLRGYLMGQTSYPDAGG